MARIDRPLDPDARAAADAAVESHTGGRALTMSDGDEPLRRQWALVYNETISLKRGLDAGEADLEDAEDDGDWPSPVHPCPEVKYNFLVFVPGTTQPFNLTRIQGGESRANANYWTSYPAFIPTFTRLMGILLRNTTHEPANQRNESGSFHSFEWNGHNNVIEREKAGRNLAEWIKDRYSDYAGHNVFFHFVGHSHGGNVINEMSRHWTSIVMRNGGPGWKIRSVTYLSTPFFKHIHPPHAGGINGGTTLINVRNRYDTTQRTIADFSLPALGEVLAKLAPRFKNLLEAVTHFVVDFGPVEGELAKALGQRPLRVTFADRLANKVFGSGTFPINDFKLSLAWIMSATWALLQPLYEFLEDGKLQPHGGRFYVASELRRRIQRWAGLLKASRQLLTDNQNRLLSTASDLSPGLQAIQELICDLPEMLGAVPLCFVNKFDDTDNDFTRVYLGTGADTRTIIDVSAKDPYHTSPKASNFESFMQHVERQEADIHRLLFGKEIPAGIILDKKAADALASLFLSLVSPTVFQKTGTLVPLTSLVDDALKGIKERLELIELVFPDGTDDAIMAAARRIAQRLREFDIFDSRIMSPEIWDLDPAKRQRLSENDSSALFDYFAIYSHSVSRREAHKELVKALEKCIVDLRRSAAAKVDREIARLYPQ